MKELWDDIGHHSPGHMGFIVFLVGMAIFLFAALSGCTTTKGTFCQIAKPHRFSDATVNAMTDAEVQQELTFNKQGAKLCGWRP